MLRYGVAVLVACLVEAVVSHDHEWRDPDLVHDRDQEWMTAKELARLDMDHDWRTKRGGQKMCGDKLIHSLAVICDYKYNKRGHEGEDWMMDSDEPSSRRLGGGVWRSRRHAVAMLSRVRRGVVDECCTKACSINELSSYCLAPSSTA